MGAVSITPADLAPFATIAEAKALEMIEDAMGQAEWLAPCITQADFAHARAAKSVIRGAILRWNDAESGATTQKSAGPYQVTIDSNTRRNGMFWPSEIKQLQDMCRSGSSGAFSVDTAGTATAIHQDVCSLNLGATFCSCGADLAGSPLWEGCGE